MVVLETCGKEAKLHVSSIGRILNNHTVRNGAIFNYYYDAIADVEVVLGAIGFFDIVLVDNIDIVANAYIFINNCLLDSATPANADRDATCLSQQSTLLIRLEEIRSH